MKKTPIKKLTLRKETLRELHQVELDKAAGGSPVTGLCRQTLQVPSCLPSCYCTPEI